jgi:anaerobic selenocysteine-containing dehydrogenase
MRETRTTTCNRDCPDACRIVATVEDGRVIRLGGDPDHPVTRGFLCYRTQHFLATQYSPERLTAPLLRGQDGSFHPIGWDEALDLCAERLTTIARESGPAAIFHYRSGGSLGLLKLLTDRFFHCFGPVTGKRGDICYGAGARAQATDFGHQESHDLFDLLSSRNILLWGKNVFVRSPHSIPVLRQARANGASLVLIDPVHHRTASICDAYHQVRPGGDFALAMAVARTLFERGWTDPRAAEYCDHLDELRALACSRSTAAWCAAADVAPAVAEDLAHRLGPGGPTAILIGWGMGRRSNGGAIVRALDALAAISGNLGRPGGGAAFFIQQRSAFDTSPFQAPAPPPRTICEPLLGPELLALRDPPVRAVWITCANPVAMLPESVTTAEALRTRDFVVVVDSFLTDTARLAHLVLPTTTLLEADDVVGAYGHHWLGVARPVVDPPPGVRSDLEIIQGLARRVGLAEQLSGTAAEWKERLIAPKLGSHGITLEGLEASPRNPLVPPVLYADRKFPTPTGRVQLVHEAPPDPAAGPDPEYPLTLLSLATDRSQASQWAVEPAGPLAVTVHPDAAGGLADGAPARLESRHGALAVTVRHDARQRRDVALVPKGGHLRAGRCVNALIGARTTDLGEGAALHDERVRLVPPAGEPAAGEPAAAARDR